MWSKFWHWLTTGPERFSSPEKKHPDLNPIDVVKLAAELDLEAKARELGQHGLPDVNSKVLAGPEALVVQKVEKARQDYIDWAQLRLSVINEELNRRDITNDVNRAREADSEFERKASSLLTDRQSTLRSLSDAAASAQRSLERFRTQNRLERDARLGTPAGGFLRIALLFFFIVLEGVFNATFFSQGLSTGLVGGFSYAAILAAVNVIVAFLLGKYGLPNLNHVSGVRRLLGVVALIVAATFVLTMGLSIAHIRDSLTAELSNPMKAALIALTTSPFELQDIFSWILFAISISFATGALFDGLYSDDRYPGYGAVAREAQQAIADYEDEIQSLREDLDELREDALQALEDTVRQSQVGVAEYQTLIDDKKTTESRLSRALGEASYALDALLKMFRSQNEIARPAGTRPSYFDTFPELLQLDVPDFSVEQNNKRLKQQQALLASLLSEVEGVRGTIQAAFNQKFDQVKTLNIHFPAKDSLQ